MITELFDANLERLRLINTGQSPTGKEVNKTLLMENFLMATYDLGFLLSNEPCLHKSLDFQLYVEESVLLWPTVRHRIRGFIHRTEVILNYAFQGDEWLRVCHRRSAIEFFKDFYQGTSLENRVKALEISALDEKIRRVGEVEGYLENEEIPAAMPPEHWWWWYPALPPEHERLSQHSKLTSNGSNGHQQSQLSDFTQNEAIVSQRGASVFSRGKSAYQELAQGTD